MQLLPISLNLALLLLCLGKCLAIDLCNKTECNGVHHLGCDNDLTFHSSCLRNRVLVNMQMYRDYLVKIHNKYREDVASGSILGLSSASHMPEILWHSKLALLAEYHVKRCLSELSMYCVAIANFSDPVVNYGSNWANIQSDPNYHSTMNSEKIIVQTEQWLHQVYKLAQGDERSDEIPEIKNILNDHNHYMGCAAAEDYDRISSRFVLICYYDNKYDVQSPIYEKGTFSPANCSQEQSGSYKHLCKTQIDLDD